jgi:hypothetical protein
MAGPRRPGHRTHYAKVLFRVSMLTWRRTVRQLCEVPQNPRGVACEVHEKMLSI